MGEYDPCDVSIVSLGETNLVANDDEACATVSRGPLEPVDERPHPEKNAAAWDLGVATGADESKASAKSWFSNPFRKGSRMNQQQQIVETVEVSEFGHRAPSPATPPSGKTSSVGIGGTGTAAAAAAAQAAVNAAAMAAPGVVPSRSSSRLSVANATVADGNDGDEVPAPRCGGAGWDLTEPLKSANVPASGAKWFRPPGIRGTGADSETQVTAFEGRPDSP